ncbi:MAG: protein kinase domain-containing protein [Nannocystaceae bacterium]|nr:serine/threonine-protein kinase [bacterium]
MTVTTVEDSELEGPGGLGAPPVDTNDELISERDRVAATLFDRPNHQTRVGRYVVEKELGAGAMGVVYEAWDEELERAVALKVIRKSAWESEDVVGRFRREARALAKLSHPNVVTIHEVGQHHDRDFIAMELVGGKTLRDWMGGENPDWRSVIEVFVQAGRGLEAAHRAGLIHRDFKPANCILGSDGRVRVLDFGLARGLANPDSEATESSPSAGLLDATLTATGALVGTPAYMAPEQLCGQAVDAASDQFAFCVALYEALTGARPFEATTAVGLYSNIRDGTIREPDVARSPNPPRALMSLVVRGLAYRPELRWPDISELLDAIERYPVRRRRRRVLVLGTTAGAVAIGATALAGKDAPCDAVSGRALPAWSNERQDTVREAILSSGPKSEAVWRTFEASADRWAEGWLSARVHACEEALVRGTTSPGIYDRQLVCLDRHADTISTYLEELSGDENAWRTALDFAAAFPPLGSCTNPAQILARDAPSPAIANEVAEIRRLIDRAHAKQLSGDLGSALTGARAAVERSQEIADPRSRARANLFLGHLNEVAAEDAPEPLLLSALRNAEEASADDLSAAVAIELMVFAGANHHVNAAKGWEALASAKLARTGAPPPKHAELALASTELALALGDPAGAARHASRAEALYREGGGPDAIQAARTAAMRALALELSGDGDAALVAHDENVRAHEAAFGQHPATANALFLRASFRSNLGKHDAAAADYEQALGILEGVAGVERLLANARMGLVLVRSMSGDLELAEVDRATEPLKRLPPDDPLQIVAIEWRAAVLQRIGHPQLALAEYARAARKLEEQGDTPEQDLAMLQNNAAECELALGRLGDARGHFADVLSTLERTVAPNDPRLAYPLAGLGRAELGLGNPSAAKPHFERGLTLLEDGWGDTPLLAQLHWGLAQSLPDASLESARRAATEAADLFEKLGDEGREELSAVNAWLEAAR